MFFSQQESKRLYIQVLKRAEVEHGKRSTQVASALNALGMLSKKMGQYAGAIKYYKAAIKLKVSLCGGEFNHAEIGEFLANLGDVFRKESNYSQAEALYQRALQVLAGLFVVKRFCVCCCFCVYRFVFSNCGYQTH
jgi:tetratricopeptide (TPR) repeat protein